MKKEYIRFIFAGVMILFIVVGTYFIMCSSSIGFKAALNNPSYDYLSGKDIQSYVLTSHMLLGGILLFSGCIGLIVSFYTFMKKQ